MLLKEFYLKNKKEMETNCVFIKNDASSQNKLQDI